MIKNIFSIICLGLLLVSCMDEVPGDKPTIAAPGDAVQFVAGLKNVDTKTIYGDENADGKSIKVNWVKNDLVSIYGSEALEGRQQGTYKVTSVNEQNGYSYAGELEMQGTHGVQWGAESSMFYAVYPSTSGNFTNDGNGGVKVPMTINAIQSNFFTYSGGVWRGTQGTSPDDQTMVDAIMYACSDGKVSSGSTVSLQFKPFSTVLKFTLNGVGTENGATTQTKVYINEIQLTAPSGNICGTFPMAIASSGTASADVTPANMTNASNKIIIKPYSDRYAASGTVDNNIYVSAEDKIEFSVFTIPQTGLNLHGWKVTIVTSHGTRTFTINSPTGTNAQLLAGQIHKVNVPVLDNLEDDFQFNPGEWISQLPPAVYLSELSLPGSWYSTNTEDAYQVVSNGSTNLEGQYAAGIRAFNIDCRLSLAAGLDMDNAFGNITTGGWLQEVCDYRTKESISHFYDGKLELVCAGTEKEETERYMLVANRPTGKMTSIGKTVEQAMIELGELITRPENTDEFIEVIISVSEKVKDHDGRAAQVPYYTYGTINPRMVLEAIAYVLNKDSVKKYLYKDHITEDTTIEDVLGKIVVKVNMNTSNEKILSYGLTSGAVNDNFSAPMMLSMGSMATENSGDIVAGNFISYNSEEAPKMICGLDYKEGTLRYHNHQANGTGQNGQPTAAQRQNIVKEIMNVAASNYSATPHIRAWYQLGIGGSYNGDYERLAEDMNSFMYMEVMKKMGYSFNNNGSLVTDDSGNPVVGATNITPVGIVLMNRCLDEGCYGPQLIDAILKLNAKLKMDKANRVVDNTGVGVDSWDNELL